LSLVVILTVISAPSAHLKGKPDTRRRVPEPFCQDPDREDVARTPMRWRERRLGIRVGDDN